MMKMLVLNSATSWAKQFLQWSYFIFQNLEVLITRKFFILNYSKFLSKWKRLQFKRWTIGLSVIVLAGVWLTSHVMAKFYIRVRNLCPLLWFRCEVCLKIKEQTWWKKLTLSHGSDFWGKIVSCYLRMFLYGGLTVNK